MDVLLVGKDWKGSSIKMELEESGLEVETMDGNQTANYELLSASVIIVDANILHDGSTVRAIKNKAEGGYIIAQISDENIEGVKALVGGCDDFFSFDSNDKIEKAKIINKWVSLYRQKSDILCPRNSTE